MKGIDPVMLNTVATAKIDGQWRIVRRVINTMDGSMSDQVVDGELPYAAEGPAEQRASEVAIEMGNASRPQKAGSGRHNAKKYIEGKVNGRVRSQGQKDFLDKLLFPGETD